VLSGAIVKIPSGISLMIASYLATGVAAAGAEVPATATVAPGARYSAGPIFRFFFGSQWRGAWTTPIDAPALNLKTFDGGLRPVRRGGGLQTKNLRLETANGDVWTFRSIDKDASRLLDPDTRASVLGDIVQDLTSTSHPCAPVVVAPLLEAAGVLHATPQLILIPDDPGLGEFRDFGGVLGFIEKRIDETTPGVRKLEDTFDLFARLERRTDERVDAREYLRARLIDLLVGDWDRHVDQWRWARFDQDGSRIWRPVPRDRDQAFSRFDGIIPSVSEYYTKQLTSFRTSYPALDKLTFAGRFTDRRFLVGLDKREWDSVTSELVAKLTDAVIADAVRRLPPAMYAQGGDELERTLRARRDALPKASEDFYRLLADRVDVRGTDGAESIEVKRQAGGAVEIAIYERGEEAGKKKAGPLFRRTFLSEETSEIRLYTLGGADHVVLEGDADRSIQVLIVAPRGTAEVLEKGSHSSATKLLEPRSAAGLPPPAAGTPEARDPNRQRQRYEPFRDWGHDLFFFPLLSYDSTRGLVPGARAQLTQYGFGREPFASQMNFAAAWSTGTNRPRLEYNADVRTRTPMRGLFYAGYSGVEVVSFFGFGNETVRDPALLAADFYRVRQEQLVVSPVLEMALAGPLRSRAGVLFKHVQGAQDSGIGATGLYGSGSTTLASGELGLALDTRSGVLTAQRGVSLLVSGRHTPKLFGNEAAFSKVRAEATAVTGAHILTDVMLDLRVAGEKNWGRYPYFEAAFLGGAAQRSQLDMTGVTGGSTLRGYDLNRFAGDASVVGNAELRVALGKARAFLPFRYGLVALSDLGRVFRAGESSSRWHSGYGGGLWLALLASGAGFQIATSMNATVVRSDEGTAFYFSSGFGL
jgi:hypothetical protein